MDVMDKGNDCDGELGLFFYAVPDNFQEGEYN